MIFFINMKSAIPGQGSPNAPAQCIAIWRECNVHSSPTWLIAHCLPMCVCKYDGIVTVVAVVVWFFTRESGVGVAPFQCRLNFQFDWSKSFDVLRLLVWCFIEWNFVGFIGNWGRIGYRAAFLDEFCITIKKKYLRTLNKFRIEVLYLKY